MRFVSPLLRKVVYPAMHYSGWLRRSVPGDGCAVVNYHGVIPSVSYCRHPFLDDNLVSAAALREQLRFLKANYNVVAPEAFREWIEKEGTLPPRPVLLTCDDGLLNNLSEMLPILQNEAVQCLFFVTGESCREHPGMLWYEELYRLLASGEIRDSEVRAIFETHGETDWSDVHESNFQGEWWRLVVKASGLDARVRADKLELLRGRCKSKSISSALAESRYRLLNVRELQQLAESGMSIGAHTMSHPVLAQCSEDEALREINQSKAEIERALGQTVWAFAYPFGNPATMGEREVDFAGQAGFECAFVNVGGGVAEHSKRFELSRTHVTANMSLAEFEAHLTGFHTRLQAAVRG